MREEDQQTITVEVELKRHDSEPTISVPQPSPEARSNTMLFYLIVNVVNVSLITSSKCITLSLSCSLIQET